MTSRRLLFVTGTRADFGKLEPLALAAQQAGFAVGFFITGMHMMRRYGETRLEVKRFPGAEFFEFVNQREGDAQDFILSKTILGFSDFVHEHRPDLVVIHGDRVEALAASIVCAMKYIPSAHIEGGEVSGTIDESIRHCNTKLCAAHFVSSEGAKQRVLALGESPESVYNIGSPELDTHARPSGVTLAQVKERYAIPFDDYGIVIFHPVTSEAGSQRAPFRGDRAQQRSGHRRHLCRAGKAAQGALPPDTVDAVQLLLRAHEKRLGDGGQQQRGCARGAVSRRAQSGRGHAAEPACQWCFDHGMFRDGLGCDRWLSAGHLGPSVSERHHVWSWPCRCRLRGRAQPARFLVEAVTEGLCR